MMENFLMAVGMTGILPALLLTAVWREAAKYGHPWLAEARWKAISFWIVVIAIFFAASKVTP